MTEPSRGPSLLHCQGSEGFDILQDVRKRLMETLIVVGKKNNVECGLQERHLQKPSMDLQYKLEQMSIVVFPRHD